ncbi:alpha/beta fold hydrolase [Rhodoflexus caldus]|uniref:alpha/beta fold hydrolase n=1 Tax=Rhodoflexus caldus TaxID=2891236 RepID=UPI002029D0D8|nr:alpha/beta hydrolase [Rhodoflexus caldus]
MNNQLLLTPRGHFFVRDTNEPDKPVVILLHGWPETSYTWEALLPQLSTYRVIRPDLRGMGESERTMELSAYSKENLAQDVLAIADALNVDNFFLAGHDWGGVIAQEVALAAPERVAALCLMNINIINNAIGNNAAREAIKEKGMTFYWYQSFMQQPQLPEAMITGNEEIWLRHFLRLAHRQPFPEDVLQEYVRTFKIPGTAATSSNYYRTMYAHDLPRWQQLMESRTIIPMDCLYIHGSRDIVIIADYLKGAEQCFQSFELVSLDAGHFIQAEMPSEVGMRMAEFFHEQSFLL